MRSSPSRIASATTRNDARSLSDPLGFKPSFLEREIPHAEFLTQPVGLDQRSSTGRVWGKKFSLDGREEIPVRIRCVPARPEQIPVKNHFQNPCNGLPGLYVRAHSGQR